MKAIVEIEVAGEWEEPLSNDSMIDVLDAVICDGERLVGLDATFKIIRAIKEEK